MKRIEKVFMIICILVLSCTGCITVTGGAEDTTVNSTGVTTVPTTEPSTVTATEPLPTEPVRTEMSAPDIAEFAQKCTVLVEARGDGFTSQGSGFYIDAEGLLVTNYHVIDAADSITVKDSKGAMYDVIKIINFSEMYDIAVLKVSIEDNDYLKIAEEGVRTGETVYAVGSPLGQSSTFSNGMVSGVAEMVGVIECLQTTAPVSNGSSGGPLVNAYCEVVGINAFSYTQGENMNLAIKMGELSNLGEDLNWTMNRYREWYKKEIDHSYKVWDYANDQYCLSKINTYQYVTDQKCLGSSYSWDFETTADGYDEDYGIYVYDYVDDEFEKYTEYLRSIGFDYEDGDDYFPDTVLKGDIYRYYNAFTGFYVDIFIVEGGELVIVEAFSFG